MKSMLLAHLTHSSLLIVLVLWRETHQVPSHFRYTIHDQRMMFILCVLYSVHTECIDAKLTQKRRKFNLSHLDFKALNEWFFFLPQNKLHIKISSSHSCCQYPRKRNDLKISVCVCVWGDNKNASPVRIPLVKIIRYHVSHLFGLECTLWL